MGVLGLWQILESVGHPIKIEGLEGKRLGVDANVWLYKFIRGFREKDNATTSIDSHKLGLFNRVSKLLFYKIKPIFVFDGPAPVLKRRTLERRQNVRNKHLEKAQEIAMKVLAEQLKETYGGATVDNLKIHLPNLRSHNLVAAEKFTDEDRDLFYLPPEFREVKDDDGDSDVDLHEAAEIKVSSVKLEDTVYLDSDDDVKPDLKQAVDIDSEDFAKLPAEIRYEILQDIKESRRRIRHSHNLPEDAGSFSNLQLERLRSRRIVQEKIEQCERDICSAWTGECDGKDIRSFRMQSDASSTMLYMQNKPSQPLNTSTTSQQSTTAQESQTNKVNSEITEDAKEPRPPVVHLDKAKIETDEDRDLFYLPPESREVKDDDSEVDLNDVAERKISLAKLEDTVYLDSDDDDEPDLKQAVDIDSEDSAKLPAEIGYGILQDSKEPKRRPGHSHNFPEDADSFSNPQLERLGSRRTVQEEIEQCERDICSASTEECDGTDVKSSRTRSDASSTMLYMQNKPSQPLNTSTLSQQSTTTRADQSNRVNSEITEDAKEPRPPVVHLDKAEIETGEDRDLFYLPPESREVKDDDEDSDVDLHEVAEIKASSAKLEDTVYLDSDDDDEPYLKQAVDIDSEDLEKLPAEIGYEILQDSKEPKRRTGHSHNSPEDADSFSNPQLERLGSRRIVQEEIEQCERDICSASTEECDGTDVKSSRIQSDASTTMQQSTTTQASRTNKVTSKIIEDAKELLRLFGVPYIDAAGEAEAQCALLEELKLTEGTITDDSDVWLFGAKNVYRYFFSDDKYVMQYKMSDIEFHIKMTRENLVCFAMMVGSDYTDGIKNIGPVTALEVLSEFPGESIEPLEKFKRWKVKYESSKDRVPGSKKREKLLKFRLPEEFPSRTVFDGYMRPVADASTEKFTWGTPELDELREYARRNFGWDTKKIDERLLPVMKKLSERKTQPTIDSFFFKTAANQNPELFRSKRVNQALSKIAKTTDRKGASQKDEEVVLTDDEDEVRLTEDEDDDDGNEKTGSVGSRRKAPANDKTSQPKGGRRGAKTTKRATKKPEPSTDSADGTRKRRRVKAK